MEYSSICPNCSKPQSRWDITDPYPGFVNSCKDCGADYKATKRTNVISILISLPIVALFILASKEYIEWPVSLTSSLLFLLILVYASPYYAKLIEVPKPHRNIMKKWFIPYLRWQVVILVFAIILLGANVLMLSHNDLSKKEYCCLMEKVEGLENVGDLKKVIEYQNNSWLLLHKMDKSVFKLNIIISGVLILFLLINILFYFKIRSAHNAQADA